MKAIVAHAAKDVRIEEYPEDEPGAGEVKLRLATGGVCGSDLHYYHHGGFGTVRLKQPMILGHEVSATIVALGLHRLNETVEKPDNASTRGQIFKVKHLVRVEE